jgi:hypothetical protein
MINSITGNWWGSGGGAVTPGNPVIVSASALSDTVIRIVPGFAAYANFYQVWRSATQTGTYSLIGTLTAPNYYYDDINLAASQTWWYKLRAGNVVGSDVKYSYLCSAAVSATTNAVDAVDHGDTYDWRAVVVEWDDNNPVQLCFIINNYEDFFKDPVANGVYKYVETETLMQNWIDRQDLIFTWQKRWLGDGSTTEAPVIGSHKDTYGALKDMIQILRDNAP